MAHLRADERKQALGMLRAGMSTRNVANNFNCNHSTIVRLRQWFLVTNTGADRPRPGPRFTKVRKTCDHLLTKFATVSQNLSEHFCDFRFTTCGLLCAEVRKSINFPGPRTYQINSYIRSSKILNIKYSYFIGLCRYKSRDTLRRQRTKVETGFSGKAPRWN